VPALEVTPTPSQRTPDIVVVDGEAASMDLAVVTAAWKRRDPPLHAGGRRTAAIRSAGRRVRARFLAAPVVEDELLAEVERILSPAASGTLAPRRRFASSPFRRRPPRRRSGPPSWPARAPST